MPTITSTRTVHTGGRDWTIQVLAPEGETLERLESTVTEWGTPRSSMTTYRDYEQAGMAVTYHDGEPVMPEQPAVRWDEYPAAWDRPIEFDADEVPVGRNFYGVNIARTGNPGNHPARRQRVIERMMIQALDGEIVDDDLPTDIYHSCGGEWFDISPHESVCAKCLTRQER